MPIRQLLQDEGFGPEDIAQISAAFEYSLSQLGLVDRTDPATVLVAKQIIALAKLGVRDPNELCDAAILSLRG